MCFIDGADGSGKSTVIRSLVGMVECEVSIAPPLWKYLAPLSAPDQFAEWIGATSGYEVAVELLAAMQRRITALPTDGVVLVDRGPVTVKASAMAHVLTSAASEEDLATLEPRINELIEEQRRLATRADVSCVLLHAPLEVCVQRLRNDGEHVSPRYLAYLEALDRQLRADVQADLVVSTETSIANTTAAILEILL